MDCYNHKGSENYQICHFFFLVLFGIRTTEVSFYFDVVLSRNKTEKCQKSSWLLPINREINAALFVLLLICLKSIWYFVTLEYVTNIVIMQYEIADMFGFKMIKAPSQTDMYSHQLRSKFKIPSTQSRIKSMYPTKISQSIYSISFPFNSEWEFTDRYSNFTNIIEMRQRLAKGVFT